jgi:hypothetical protein
VSGIPPTVVADKSRIVATVVYGHGNTPTTTDDTGYFAEDIGDDMITFSHVDSFETTSAYTHTPATSSTSSH